MSTEPDYPLVHLVYRAQQELDRVLNAELVGLSITARQAVLLIAIDQAPGASQKDLVQSTGIDRSTLANMMQRLVRSGYVERSRSQNDGRANRVVLTPSGSALVERLKPVLAHIESRAAATVGQGYKSLVMGLTTLISTQSRS